MKNFAERLCLLENIKSPLALTWFSLKVEMPDCGTVTAHDWIGVAAGQFAGRAVAPDEGIAKAPLGSLALRIFKATGFAVTPKVARIPAAVLFESVRPSGTVGDVRLFISDPPLVSLVP